MTSGGRDVGKLESTCVADGIGKCYKSFENSFPIQQNVKHSVAI
jgi:hypothetical protein